jgi:hypothetical protein
MSIALTATTTSGAVAITMSPDLRWVDEHEWEPVVQGESRSVTGAMIIQPRALTAGRPITLQPDEDNSAWMSRAVLAQLRNLAAIPGQAMTLTINGQAYSVVFRRSDGSAIEAEPVAHYSTPEPTDWFRVTTKFLTLT